MAADPAQVQTWLRPRFKIWKREKPAWFTEALRRSIPTDMLPPRDARGSSVHDASLAQRLSLSLGVRTQEVTRSHVMPLGATDLEASDSESSEDEAQPPPDADTAGSERGVNDPQLACAAFNAPELER